MTPQAAKTILTCTASVLALAIWLPAQALLAQPAAGDTLPGESLATRCQALVADQQQMADDLKAQDTALATHVAKMNASPRPQKVDEIAAVVTELVSQRVALDARRASRDAAMRQHMAQHTRLGGRSLGQCPLLKGPVGPPADAPR